MAPVSVTLLHDDMLNNEGKIISTSLTLIDVHDIARSSRTYGCERYYIAHSSPTMRHLASCLNRHWVEGSGARHNPTRKEALSLLSVHESLDKVIEDITFRHQRAPKLFATSAKGGARRISFDTARSTLEALEEPALIMFGTGWGMSEQLLGRADFIIEPVSSPTGFNHLSVRSAVAIILDRLFGAREY